MGVTPGHPCLNGQVALGRGKTGGMQAISAAVVVHAGAACSAVGSLVTHGDTQGFVMLTGGVLPLAGQRQWFTTMRQPDNQNRY